MHVKIKAFFWMNLIKINKNIRVVIVHPQTIGFKYVIGLLKQNRLIELYVVDNSFFCVRSYNSIPLEDRSCLRCFNGQFENAVNNHCEPFPVSDLRACEFIGVLREAVKNENVEFLCLSYTQQKLLKDYFAFNIKTRIVGCWYNEFGVLKNCLSENGVASASIYDHDVVFHGAPLHAKGANWAYNLAKECPQLNFLFPFSRNILSFEEVNNCKFLPMTWTSGLEEAVKKARVNLIPSCWSSPIEGSLIQSIAVAKSVAVMDEKKSFVQELPLGLVVKLPHDIKKASMKLNKMIIDDWSPDPALKKEWATEFIELNAGVADKILS